MLANSQSFQDRNGKLDLLGPACLILKLQEKARVPRRIQHDGTTSFGCVCVEAEHQPVKVQEPAGHPRRGRGPGGPVVDCPAEASHEAPDLVGGEPRVGEELLGGRGGVKGRCGLFSGCHGLYVCGRARDRSSAGEAVFN